MDKTLQDVIKAVWRDGDAMPAIKYLRDRRPELSLLEVTKLIAEAKPKQKVVITDGGRAAAGFKGTADDCVCRAIAIATGKPYREVYDAINAAASTERTGKRKRGKSHARTGVHKVTERKYLASLGWQWTPTMQIGSGCKVHLRADELPPGRLIVSVSKHSVAVIDGVIHDTHDCSRGGTRCVYGYWNRPCL